MIGKRIVLGVMIAAFMMMLVCVLGAEQSHMDIFSATNALGNIDLNDKSSVQSTTITTNSTQNPTALFNYQYVRITSFPSYAWHYYYIDLAPYSTLSLTHYSLGSNSYDMEIYMDYYSKPTIYSYAKKDYVRTYSSIMTSDSKTYSNRVYIAVRNLYSYSNSGYVLSVSVKTNTVTPTPTPTSTTYYRTDNSLTLALGIPALVITVILFFVVIAQVRKINALTKRVVELEKNMNVSMPMDGMMPVMMDVPLMSANSLQQDHEEIQSVAVQQQPPVVQPTQVPQQQPTTTPQLFPQFVQQQALPPQFRNAQPYPFAYPQVVFAQPPQIMQQQPIPQQQVGQTQSKQ